MSPELRSEGDGLAVVAENPWAIAIRPGDETDNKKCEIKRGKNCVEQARGSNRTGESPCVRVTEITEAVRRRNRVRVCGCADVRMCGCADARDV